jgi:PAS domain S-box-containing protein
LENTHLYRDLEQREAKIRRLVDANIIGIFIRDLEGRILEANDAFLHMIGYDRVDLVAGRIRWTELTPPNWQDRNTQAVAEVKMTGRVQPFEKEYFRKDGSRVPVLIGVATFEEGGDEGVAFVLDLTERKRAEAEAREMQTELAHANRLATMGQLTASIAHEINQPIAGTLTNAQAALRWLRAERPDFAALGRSLDRIVRDSNRAGSIVHRIRALIKKAPPHMEGLTINDAIQEIVALTRSEVAKQGIRLRTQLAEGLPDIHGDRVQLQQVVLNLTVNAIEAMSQTSDGARDLLISSAPDGADGVQVTVRDSGPGFAPGTLEHVFDPFYTTKASGLGMGLSICRSIIDAHGGRLWAEANVPQGAVFQFTVRGGNDAEPARRHEPRPP